MQPRRSPPAAISAGRPASSRQARKTKLSAPANGSLSKEVPPSALQTEIDYEVPSTISAVPAIRPARGRTPCTSPTSHPPRRARRLPADPPRPPTGCRRREPVRKYFRHRLGTKRRPRQKALPKIRSAPGLRATTPWHCRSFSYYLSFVRMPILVKNSQIRPRFSFVFGKRAAEIERLALRPVVTPASTARDTAERAWRWLPGRRGFALWRRPSGICGPSGRRCCPGGKP